MQRSQTMRKVHLWAGFLAAVLLASAPIALSAQCGVTVQGVSFGSYDVFSTQYVDSTGAIGVSCDVATPYAVSLSPGGGSFTDRAMANGPYVLLYNLYVDAARASVWGDGSGGTATVAANAASTTHTVYGRIPARQNAHVGSYSDTITVTVNY
jgi:spore coat protein U-like protein